METVARLRREADLIRNMILVLVGAGLNCTVGLPLFLSSVYDWNLVTWSVLILAYIAIGIVYTCVASLSFQPKRLVSPTHVQIVTAPFLSVLMMDFLLKQPQYQGWVTFATSYVFVFVSELLVLLIVSMVQTSTTRYLIGLNGTKEDVLSAHLLVNASLDNVLTRIRRDEVQRALGVEREEEARRDVFLFRTSRSNEQQRFLVVCRHPNAKGMTQLVLINYELTYYVILPSPMAAVVQKRDLATLKDCLEGLTLEDEKQLATRNERLIPAVPIAYEYALACTESKILQIIRLHTRDKFIIGGIICMFAIVAVLWLFRKLDDADAISSLILLGIATLLELLPLISSQKYSRVS